MRTVVTNFTEEEKKQVKEMADASKLSSQVDIVSDIFGFMKKPDMIEEKDITEDLIDEFAKGKFEYYLPMKRKVQGRIGFFNRILSHPYYEKFKEVDPTTASMILLKMLNAFLEKKKKEKEGSNKEQEQEDEAMKEFESIIRYGRELFDLLDDEFFKQLMDEHQKRCGSSKKPNPKAGDLPKQVEDIIENMARELMIYELSQKLEFTIRTSKKGKWNEVWFPDNGLDVTRIRETKDLSKLFPTQLALDDLLFLKKFASKELLKKKYMQRQEKRQILYMMVDCSGSMGGQVNRQGLTRIDVCKAVTIALMKKMISNEDLFYFRWFEDDAQDLHKIKTKADALKFLPQMVYGTSAGGGTNIMRALEVAVRDIKDKKLEKVDLADILLVSDGDASVNAREVNEMLDNKIDLHTVFINDYNFKKGDNKYSELIQASKNFLVTSANKQGDIVEISNLMTR